MKKSFIKMILLPIMTSFCISVAGQQIQKKGNVEIYKNRNSQIQKLVFENSKNGLKKEFNIVRNSPYSTILSQGIDVSSQYGGGTYKIPKTKLKVLLKETSKLKHPEVVEEEVEYVKNEATAIENPNNEVKGVIYNFYLYNSSFQKRGAEASVRIFDQTGNTTMQFKVSTDIKVPVISPDQKYLSFKYGGIENHDEYKVFDPGFSLYTTSNQREILNIKGREGYVVSPPFMHNGLIIFTERNGFDEKYYIINPDERVHYSHTFSYDEIQNLKDITTQGLVFQQGNSEKVVRYNTAFSKTSF